MKTTIKMQRSGRITLPKEWRSRFATNTFVAEVVDDQLVLHPSRSDSEPELSLLIRNPSFDFLRDEPDLYEQADSVQQHCFG